MFGTADDIAKLIRQAQRRDRGAFEALYRRTLSPVYRYIAARVDTTDEAEELTQEVFLAALNGIESLRAENEPALLAWLFQIARHKRADRLREGYRHPTAPLEAAESVSTPHPGPETLTFELQERATVQRAMNQLTDDQREVIVCKYVLGYDNDQTGQVIGKNANVVNQLHHRALAALYRLLSREETPVTPMSGTRL